jgi:ABC-type transport system involved in multi-copper enzyme maturation permease subunit
MNVLFAEWTKLRSVPRWMITLFAATLLTIGVSMLGASSSNTDINKHPDFVTGPDGDPVADSFSFAHQPVAGDVTITVRVAALAPTPQRVHTRDKKIGKKVPDTAWTGIAAGLMIKDGTRSGSSYAAVLLTAENGVHMQSDFTQDVAGSTSTGARWLRLTRSGSTITGYESADGTTWKKIATMTPKALPATAEIGFYLSAAPEVYLSRGMGGSSMGAYPRNATATFDGVQVTSGAATAWHADAVQMPVSDQVGPPPQDTDPQRAKSPDRPAQPLLTEHSGTYTMNGSGKVGPQQPDDDAVEAALLGVIAGLMALIAVGVLFATSEYRKGMIRTTFAATPRRGRVLAAKALVLGGITFVLSLAGVVASFLLAGPALRKHGFGPPAFPTQSLLDGAVLRVLLLSALFMTGVAVFALALGTLLRHSAAAITLTVALVVLPVIAGSVLPGTSPRWLMYTTLAGGFATLRAKPPTETLAEPWAMIGPWAGLGVVCAYAVIGLGLAWWRQRRRDA